MLNKLKAPLMGMIFTLAAMPLHASSNLDRLLEVSGFTGSIEAIPQGIESEMSVEEMTAQVGDPQLAALIINITKQSFTKSLFDDSVRQSISSRITESQISEALAWYETDVGQRIAAAHQVDHFTIQQRIKAGERPQLSEKRISQIKILDQIVMATDNTRRLTLDAATNMGHAMMNGLGMPVSKSQVREMSAPEVDLQMPKIIEEYHASLGFIYKDISDEDMDLFISEMADPDATVYYDAMWNGISKAFDTAGTTMGSTLAAEIRGPM